MKRIVTMIVLLMGLVIELNILYARRCGNEFTAMETDVLPDSPFYVFVLIRDKVIPYFIRTPEKKLEFNLIMSTKLINSGQELAQKGKFDLAIDSLKKGEHYFTLTASSYNVMRAFAQTIPVWLEQKIDNVFLEHQGAFQKVLAITNDPTQNILILNIQEISHKNYATIRNYTNEEN